MAIKVYVKSKQNSIQRSLLHFCEKKYYATTDYTVHTAFRCKGAVVEIETERMFRMNKKRCPFFLQYR